MQQMNVLKEIKCILAITSIRFYKHFYQYLLMFEKEPFKVDANFIMG